MIPDSDDGETLTKERRYTLVKFPTICSASIICFLFFMLIQTYTVILADINSIII